MSGDLWTEGDPVSLSDIYGAGVTSEDGQWRTAWVGPKDIDLLRRIIPPPEDGE